MNWRYRFVLFIFLFLFLLILLRLFYWQTVRAEELASLGQAQYGSAIKLTPRRGEILTNDGFSLAANKISYLVFADPKEIKDKKKTTDTLSSLLQVDSATISALLDMDKLWVPIASHVDNNVKEKVENAKLPGVGFEGQLVRFYPEASMAANLLGFVGKNKDGEDQGYFGLEGYYDRQLRGKAGFAIQIHDALGKPILARMTDTSGKSDGRNLVMHIDRVIQFILERELKEGMEKYGAQSVEGAVMDPKTGSILAMASFPTYDPRTYYDYTDDLYLNPFITDAYEPGSTFKPIVMASAFDAELLKPESICTICSGPATIGDYTIKTWNDEYHPNETMMQTIQYSDNVGMVFVSHALGLDRMIAYMKKFGIGDTTGIDLQGEVAPQLRPKSNWYPIDLATGSFGQGITLTPIELLSAFSAIANDGVRMEPHVVASIQTPNGDTIPIPPKILGQPISSKAAKVMTEVLVNAVDNGEAKWAKPKGYRIAGKTGTAQIPVAGHYDATKTIASFIGFAPAEDSRFISLIIVNRPETSIYGAETAAPIFFNVAKSILTYYGITPSE